MSNMLTLDRFEEVANAIAEADISDTIAVVAVKNVLNKYPNAIYDPSKIYNEVRKEFVKTYNVALDDDELPFSNVAFNDKAKELEEDIAKTNYEIVNNDSKYGMTQLYMRYIRARIIKERYIDGHGDEWRTPEEVEKLEQEMSKLDNPVKDLIAEKALRDVLSKCKQAEFVNTDKVFKEFVKEIVARKAEDQVEIPGAEMNLEEAPLAEEQKLKKDDMVLGIK